MDKKQNNKKADINQKAVALSYNVSDISPRVVAKGQGYVAQKILENASISDVPVYEDKELVDELTKIDLGNNIPPELYEVVAQILVFVSDLDEREAIRQSGSKQL